MRAFDCVTNFCIFIDWKFTIIDWVYKGTRYSLGWLPIGGYIKIKDLFIYTLVRKKRKEKMFVLFAGSLMNVLIGAATFTISKEFAMLNFLIGFYNLLPFIKNDGYYIYRMLSDQKKYRFKDGEWNNYLHEVQKKVKHAAQFENIIFEHYQNGLTAEECKKQFYS